MNMTIISYIDCILLLIILVILQVVFDVQRICAILCEKMPLRLDNVFDIKVSDNNVQRAPSYRELRLIQINCKSGQSIAILRSPISYVRSCD